MIAIGCIGTIAVLMFAVYWTVRGRALRSVAPMHLEPTPGAFGAVAARELAALPNGATLRFRSGAERRVPSNAATSVSCRHDLGWRAAQTTDASSNGRAAGLGGAAAEAVVVGAATAAVTAADFLNAVWQVDEDIFQAAEALSGETVDSFGDLGRVVDARGYDLASVKLRGHIGEQEVFDHLTDAGVDVSWPSGNGPYGNPNTVGYDLQLNGHEVNVKVVGDSSVLTEHFERYPDIPVVLNGDASGIPANALHFDATTGIDPATLVGENVVLVDDALRLSDIVDAQQHAADLTDFDGADATAAAADHVPVVGALVQVVRSGYREGRLLQEGNTTTARAAQNIAIDTGGNAGGFFAGAKAGATAGAAVDAATGGVSMGLGAVTGAIIGGLTGRRVGSSVASKVKSRPLREAKEKLKRRLRKLDQAVLDAEVYTRARVAEVTEERQRQLTEELAQMRRSHLRRLEKVRDRHAGVLFLDAADAKSWAASIRREFRAEVDRQRAVVRRRWLFPPEPVRRTVVTNATRVESWAARAQAEAANLPERLEEFGDLMMVSTTGRNLLIDQLRAFSDNSVQCKSELVAAHQDFSTSSARLRRSAVRDLKQSKREQIRAAREQLVPHIDKVKKARDKVDRELAALGHGR